MYSFDNSGPKLAYYDAIAMRKLSLLLAVSLICFSGQSQVKASSNFPTCGTATLAAYEAGGPCSLTGSGGTLEFTNFEFFSSGSGSVSTLDSDILVTLASVGQLNVGFIFTGFTPAGDVGPGQSATYSLDYTYAILGDPPTAAGSSIGMDPVSGNVTINEAVCPDGAVGAGCPSLSVNSLNNPTSDCEGFGLSAPCWVDSAAFTVTSFANVYTTISLDCTDASCTGAHFDDFGTLNPVLPPPAVPEPITSAMGLGGLAAIILLRRFWSLG